jgi:hypothetical protein
LESDILEKLSNADKPKQNDENLMVFDNIETIQTISIEFTDNLTSNTNGLRNTNKNNLNNF